MPAPRVIQVGVKRTGDSELPAGMKLAEHQRELRDQAWAELQAHFPGIPDQASRVHYRYDNGHQTVEIEARFMEMDGGSRRMWLCALCGVGDGDHDPGCRNL